MVPPAAGVQGARRGAVTTEEERRRNRMTSNRLSARKSRMKRQQYVDDLTAENERLRRENEAMRASVADVLQRSRAVEQENRVLAAHARQLCAALLLRNSQLRLLGDVAGVPLDVPGVPDHLVQLYGGVQMPVTPVSPSVTTLSPSLSESPPPPPPPPLQLQLPLEIQLMLLQPDVMDVVGTLEF